MTAGQWGQVFVVWIILAAIAALFLGKIMKRRKVEMQPKYAIPVRVISGNDVALPRDPMKYEGRDLTKGQQELLREQNAFNARRLSPAERQKAIECGFAEEEEAQPFALDDPQGPRAA